MDNNPVSANSVAKSYQVTSNLGTQYKEHLSGYRQWEQLDHAEDWILFGKNLSSHVCIDEVALSQGELYTVITSGSAKCQKGALIAMVQGVKSDAVIKVLEKIPLPDRKQVKEVTTDLASNMKKIGSLRTPDLTPISLLKT